MKNASAGDRFPAAEHPFAVDFQRSLKLIENLPVKTSKLHSLRQKETKPKQATPPPPQHSGTKQIATDHFARKHCWNVCLPAPSFMLKCQSTLYVKILFI